MTCEVTANFTADFREQVAIQLQREGFLVPPSAPNRDVAIMWGNVRLRHIPRRPRTSVWSEELRRRPLDSETRAVVRRVCVASEKGKNLNPHLSRKHLTASFNDLLFNELARPSHASWSSRWTPNRQNGRSALRARHRRSPSPFGPRRPRDLRRGPPDGDRVP